jgi:putative transcriptional regulator|tara:strand:- start:805 stop:1347 length:543 start_codon:yes stop_codon:yes gene_type:complete
MILDSFRGKLLIAKPNVMRDPHFAKSVVYIYEQTDKVCVGLVLNKPSYMNVGDIQTMRGVHNSGAAGHLYRGGPVSEQSLMLLHTDDWYSTNTIQATHGNAISSDELMLEKMEHNNMPKCWRLMSGMSTWLVPQLQAEIYKHKAWLVVEPNQEIFYNFDEEDQWQAGINLASSRLMDQLF